MRRTTSALMWNDRQAMGGAAAVPMWSMSGWYTNRVRSRGECGRNRALARSAKPRSSSGRDIRDWEFWCEPENGWRGPVSQRRLWLGTPERFFDFYRAVATAMKRADPSARIGLAGFTHPWFVLPADDPDSPPGWRDLLPWCVAEALPVDFVSWHRYTDSWAELAELATAVRGYLDSIGLSDAESHLTEWNYNPTVSDADGSFTFMQSRRRAGYQRYEQAAAVAHGVPGAAFTFGTLATLQDAPVEQAHLYRGGSMPYGLFATSGRPHTKYYAIEEFGRFARLGGQRVRTETDRPDTVAALAVADEHTVDIGVAYLGAQPAQVTVHAGTHGGSQARQLDAAGWSEAEAHADAVGTLTIPFSGPGLVVLELRRDPPTNANQ